MKWSKNSMLQVLVDVLVIVIAFTAAYAIRFEGIPHRVYLRQFLVVLPYLVLLRIAVFGFFGVYRLMWRYVGLRDLPRILSAVFTGTAVLVLTRFILGPLVDSLGIVLNTLYATVPFGVLGAEFILTSGGIIAVRALWRFIKEETRRPVNVAGAVDSGKQRAVLIGAGAAGVMVAREVGSNPDIGFDVVGFLDDDSDKTGSIILGHKVLGRTDKLEELAQQGLIDLAVITMANVPAKTIRHVVDLAETASLRVQIIPGLFEILSGKLNISKIRDVAIEDLLGREPVHLDADEISNFLTDKKVLVTGAGGSIGSEICRQVCHYHPREVVLLDQAENPLFHIHRDLVDHFPDVPLTPVVGNVAVEKRMRQVITTHRPQVVFHAAAHKHVPLMEANVGEAIRNNVAGSSNLANLAQEHSVEAFVMISTDKAVNPTSVMGATKRLAEMYVQGLSESSKTRFITVRFGNVLGSEGSVVPIFKEQIARGGPVAVTHPEMKRYFMTIPEASQLVLQSAAMGEGGEIFILEMGVPIKIVNLARDLIRLSGYKPDDDIQIEFSGIRPGEKLHEELNLSEENATQTRHPRIWIGKCGHVNLDQLRQATGELISISHTADPNRLLRQLASLVPEYQRTLDAPQTPSGDGEDDPAPSVFEGTSASEPVS